MQPPIHRSLASLSCLLIALAAPGCSQRGDSPPPEPVAAEAVAAAPVARGSASSAASPPPLAERIERPKPIAPEIVVAQGGGDSILPVVRAELARAERDERDLVIYVGAKWCEPCQAFKEALKGGQLHPRFASLRVLEFDLDRDRERLDAAGCRSRMIPLFARPDADGRCGEERFEGAPKGPAGLQAIQGRLSRLIGPDRGEDAPGTLAPPARPARPARPDQPARPARP